MNGGSEVRLFCALALGAFLTACASSTTPADTSALNEYVGRYAAGPLDVLSVDQSNGRLALTPPYWQSQPLLDRVAGERDSFFFALPETRPDRRLRFERNSAGAIIGVRTAGVDSHADACGLFRPLAQGAVTPIDHIMRGEVFEGVAAAHNAGAADADIQSVAERLLQRFPSKAGIAAQILEQLAVTAPQSADVQALLGDANIMSGERAAARVAFTRALMLDPHNAEAASGRARLDAAEPPAGQGYHRFFPYAIDTLFAPPAAAEIDAVRADWAARDLSPHDVSEIATLSVSISGAPFVAHVLRHSVHRQAHVGVIFVPANAHGALPVVVDARGVDPDFTPLDLEGGSRAMKELGDESAHYIFVVPAFRGETLRLAGHSFTAEGDPADGWDGATDDAIALLSVALERIPGADPHRIAAFGQSRGGAVALLMGVRDPRIALVIDQAGPVDWFSAMDQDGWTTAEVLRVAMADGAAPTPREDGGQFYQRYIQPVHEGRLDLAGARLRMIAASPLYFARDLRRTLAMYGAEDRAVPVANARALASVAGPSVHVTVFANRGHDLDLIRASAMVKEALENLRNGS